MISFACTGCSETLQVGDDFAGRNIRCAACKTVVVVPAPAAPPAPATTSPSVRKAEDAPARSKPVPEVAGDPPRDETPRSRSRRDDEDRDDRPSRRDRRDEDSDDRPARRRSRHDPNDSGSKVGWIVAGVASIAVLGFLGLLCLGLLLPVVQKVREAAARAKARADAVRDVDPARWVEFGPDEVGYAIRIPETPVENNAGIPPDTGRKFALERPVRRQVFLVAHLDLRAVRVTPDNLAKLARSERNKMAETLKGRFLDEKDLRLEGHAGKEFRIAEPDGKTFVGRIFLVPHEGATRVILVGAAGLPNDPDVVTFLDSVRLRPPLAARVPGDDG